VTSSRRYVNQILSRLPKSQLHLSTRISHVSSTLGKSEKHQKVEITTNDHEKLVYDHEKLVYDHEKLVYDHVIFACHSDDVLHILQAGDMRENEQQILGSFEWNKNEVVLHSDPSASVFIQIERQDTERNHS